MNLRSPFYVHTLFKGIYDLSTDKIISDDRSIYSATSYMGEQMRRRRNLTFGFDRGAGSQRS